MNMCVVYGVAFAILAMILRRRGYYWPSRAMWSMAGGLAVLAPLVIWSADWAAWGSLIWTAVSYDLTALAAAGRIQRLIPCLGYALTGTYWLNYVDSLNMLPIAHVPTWVSAATGVAMAALICGPLAHDAARTLRHRLDRAFTRRRTRRAFLRGSPDDAGLLALSETEDQPQGAR